MTGLCVTSVVIEWFVSFVWFPLLRYSLNPVIAKIERFKQEKGEHPKQLESLVPDYLAVIPECFPPGMPISW